MALYAFRRMREEQKAASEVATVPLKKTPKKKTNGNNNSRNSRSKQRK